MLGKRAPNGSLDSGNDAAWAVVIQPNGDIVVIGFSEDNTTGVTDIAHARYLG